MKSRLILATLSLGIFISVMTFNISFSKISTKQNTSLMQMQAQTAQASWEWWDRLTPDWLDGNTPEWSDEFVDRPCTYIESQTTSYEVGCEYDNNGQKIAGTGHMEYHTENKAVQGTEYLCKPGTVLADCSDSGCVTPRTI